MNIPFCFWLWRRAAAGDRIELMVHEPYLHLWEGSWRQTAAAAVHRVMTAVLLRAATRVWIAVPAWEPMWKPYAFGRSVPFTWVPIPSGVSLPDALEVRGLRARLGANRHPVIGHLGTYGSLVSALLDGLLPDILRQLSAPQVLLIGAGSEQYRAAFLIRHPQYADRIGATGPLSERALATHIAACDLLVQPYPDGITSRRTTAMAGLRLGVPIVTTSGYLTEHLWEETGAVRLSAVADRAGTVAHVADLLARADVRARLGETGRDVYARLFDISRTVAALTGAAPGRAA
jgi:glycosyltransferase involved in cell wall biosynthesis